MRLPRWIEPRDVFAGAITLGGWAVMAAVWVTTTRSDIETMQVSIAAHATVIDEHSRAIADNASWHAALSAHADQDRRELAGHESRIRALESALGKIDVVANDVGWIKAYLANPDHSRKP